MPYSIRIEATIKETDDNGDDIGTLSRVTRYYDGRELSDLPAAADHFGKLLVLSAEGAIVAKQGENLSASED